MFIVRVLAQQKHGDKMTYITKQSPPLPASEPGTYSVDRVDQLYNQNIDLRASKSSHCPGRYPQTHAAQYHSSPNQTRHVCENRAGHAPFCVSSDLWPRLALFCHTEYCALRPTSALSLFPRFAVPLPPSLPLYPRILLLLFFTPFRTLLTISSLSEFKFM